MTLAADLLRAPLSRCAAASAAQKRAAGRAWIVLTASPELWAGTMQPLSSIHAERRVNGEPEPGISVVGTRLDGPGTFTTGPVPMLSVMTSARRCWSA